MGNVGEWLAVCAVVTGLVNVMMSWARGRAPPGAAGAIRAPSAGDATLG